MSTTALSTESEIEGVWLADKTLPYFNGHFPNRPILPAVATIELCIGFLKTNLRQPQLRIAAIKSAKFASPILPETQVATACSQTDGEWKCTMKEKASGRLLAEITVVLV